MEYRWAAVAIEVLEPAAVAGFWAALLGWSVRPEADGACRVSPSDAGGGRVDLVLVPARGPVVGPNRAHLDVATRSLAHQRSLVDQAIELGARPADIGQGDVPWRVLRDPAGQAFCVLEPRASYQDCGALAALVIDRADPVAAATSWAGRLGRARIRTEPGDPPPVVGVRAGDSGPWLEFLRNPASAAGADRLRPALESEPAEAHLDPWDVPSSARP